MIERKTKDQYNHRQKKSLDVHYEEIMEASSSF